MNKKFFILKLTFYLCIGIAIIAAPFSSAVAKNIKIKTMTRNLYLGADIFKVVEAALNPDPDLEGLDVPIAVAEVYQTMLFTNFWARAEALADEIASAKPQVIGLQEVSTYYIQSPGDFLIGNPAQAEDLVIDFYTVLNNALKARGMYYSAFINTNADVELPMVIFDEDGNITGFDDVRMVDHDVALVRKRHRAREVLKGNYEYFLSMDLNGDGTDDVEFKRGYLIVDVVIKGAPYRFVNTHLEIRDGVGSPYRFYQSAQMQELLGTVDFFQGLLPKPIIMVGDFNSSREDVPGYFEHPAYGPLLYVPPYMQAANPIYGGHYADAWRLQCKYDEGYTSGFDDLVSDPTAELTSRIDLVFIDPLDQALKKVSCDVVGDEVSDMIPNPNAPGMYLWPSDHAGVVAKVKFKHPK